MDELDTMNPWIHLIKQAADAVPDEIGPSTKRDIQLYWSHIELEYIRLNSDRNSSRIMALYYWLSAVRLLEQTERFVRLYGFLLYDMSTTHPA